MATVTTTFHPDPTCFAPSNLWLDVSGGNYGCGTYYPPFSPRPTEIVIAPECPFTRLGRRNWNDLQCDQNNWVATGSNIYSETAYSACPDGMTGVATDTSTRGDGITIVLTACCPTAYDFAPASLDPTPVPSLIRGTTYPVTFWTSTSYCKAASIKDLSGQKVTLTVSTSPTLSTTEVAWDYENDFIVVTAATVWKFLYTDAKASTTSTCFGPYNCPFYVNPLKPSPTHASPSTYIPPPSPAVTQFTPSPSCLSGSSFWLVSARCSVDSDSLNGPPPWLQCTHTVAGGPDRDQTVCYQGGRSTLVSGTPTWYSACPVGYTAATLSVHKPFNKYQMGFDIEASTLYCCPSAFGDMQFTHIVPGETTTTVHDGTTKVVRSARRLPSCVASRVSQPKDTTVTMGLYSDALKGEPGRKYDGTTDAVWDEAHNTVYALGQTVLYTVFHGTNTCFEECDEYFTYSYYDTKGTPVPRTTTTRGGRLSSTSSSAGAVPTMVRGDKQAALSVVVVVVTVVHVAIGAFV